MFKEINILRIFFDEPTREFNVREVARMLKIAPATASKELNRFAEMNLLKKRDERNFKLYKADPESDAYRDMKTYYNIRKIKESGLLEQLNRFYLKPTVVLFGSAAYGLDNETSDFDILVVSEKTKRFSVIKEYEKILKRNIQILAVRNIKNLKNKHLINNVLNGIRLQGEIKWI